MAHHRISIRAQGNDSAISIDGKSILAKHVIVDLQRNAQPSVIIYIEPSVLELDLVLTQSPAATVYVVAEEPTTQSKEEPV